MKQPTLLLISIIILIVFHFSISIPGCRRKFNNLEDGIIDKLKNLLNLRSQSDFEVHVAEVRGKGNQIKIGDKNIKHQISVFLLKKTILKN